MKLDRSLWFLLVLETLLALPLLLAYSLVPGERPLAEGVGVGPGSVGLEYSLRYILLVNFYRVLWS